MFVIAYNIHKIIKNICILKSIGIRLKFYVKIWYSNNHYINENVQQWQFIFLLKKYAKKIVGQLFEFILYTLMTQEHYYLFYDIMCFSKGL